MSSVAGSQVDGVYVKCPEGYDVTGGGFADFYAGEGDQDSSMPFGNGWYFREEPSSNESLCYAICCQDAYYNTSTVKMEDNESVGVTVDCPNGTVMVGGGFSSQDASQHDQDDNHPAGNGWHCMKDTVESNSSCYAVCATPSSHLDCVTLTVTKSQTEGVDIDCPCGYTITSGGFSGEYENQDDQDQSSPYDNGWHCLEDESPESSMCYARCCKPTFTVTTTTTTSTTTTTTHPTTTTTSTTTTAPSSTTTSTTPTSTSTTSPSSTTTSSTTTTTLESTTTISSGGGGGGRGYIVNTRTIVNLCYNGVQDEGEEGVDCGGKCSPCSLPEEEEEEEEPPLCVTTTTLHVLDDSGGSEPEGSGTQINSSWLVCPTTTTIIQEERLSQHKGTGFSVGLVIGQKFINNFLLGWFILLAIMSTYFYHVMTISYLHDPSLEELMEVVPSYTLLAEEELEQEALEKQ